MRLSAAEREELTLLSELNWRTQCRQNLVEYARSIPIPGVPQDDNYEQYVALHQAWDDEGEQYDNQQYINRIETELADHHILILTVCQDMVECKLIAPDGRICRRVMLFFPPGSAKSTYADVVFPTWYMGNNPGAPVILTGYADGICKKHGKRARQVCMSPEFKALFSTALDPTTKAAHQWALLNGSEYLSAGLQSGLTGNRAWGLIWDDPVKGRAAAESLAEQRATWDAYRDDARTRKIPEAWELGIQTRWHLKDLAGRILPADWKGESGYVKGQDGNWWYVLCVPAISEQADDPLGRELGEPLWPEWFKEDDSTENFWAPLRLDARAWSSLYMQNPQPPEGTLVKQEWVQYYDQLPEHLEYFLSGDYAVTREEDASDPDWTVLHLWGVDPDRKIHMIDGWKGRTAADVWIEAALDLVDRYGPSCHVAGAGPVRRGTEPFFKLRMIERGSLVRMVWLPETFKKHENFRSFQALMSNGLVYWPRNSELAEYTIRELIGFGTVPHDDAFDSCAMIGRWLHKLWAAEVPEVPDEPVIIKPQEMTVNQLVAKFDRARSKPRW